MSTDLGLEATRAVREKISREHGNDPRRLVDHYMKYQQRFCDRLRRAPGSHDEPTELEVRPDASGGSPADR
jgi:hypothetical protein